MGKLIDKSFEKGHTRLNYLLYLPDAYGKDDRPWPLVLFLHGMGDKLEKLKQVGLPAQIERTKESRFLLVAPECPGRGWNTRDLLNLLDEVMRRYRVDRNRVYLTGLSMGGYGTWWLAIASPRRFAAIIPICGGGYPKSAAKIKHVPVWAFHGSKDPVVPSHRSEAMVKALKKVGAKEVRLTLYPEAGHDSWTRTYSNPEVWDWLLKQKRNVP